MRGYGWCLLRASIPEPTKHFDAALVEALDGANVDFWAEFRAWMEQHPSPWLSWSFSEQQNNDAGVLTFSLSRNHRSSVVWDMLEWIGTNGPGSYGLFYVHDDEDDEANPHYGRGQADYSNVFRVHRLLRGELVELADPFFGSISPDIEAW